MSAPESFDDLVDRLVAEQAGQEEPAETPGGPEAQERPEPPLRAGELETLGGFLDFLRATILLKSEGLDDHQASDRLLGSATTVTGMIRHLADTERFWFRAVLGGIPPQDVGYSWSDPHDQERGWDVSRGDSLEQAREDYRAACEQSRFQLRGREADEAVHGHGAPRSVRWVVAHMIEETARHAGQLDVITELLDGRTGE